jgi:hypothetical protein
MSRVCFRTGGVLALAAGAGLGLAGCHSSSPAASSPGTASTTAAASTAATATSGAVSTAAASTAPASSAAAGSGGTTVAYFPAAVGDTWVYQVSDNLESGTATNRVTAVTPTAGGSLITEADSETLAGVPISHTYQYVIHPDGSITVPVASSGNQDVTVKSGQLQWPSPAQILSGQSITTTLVLAVDESGTTSTVDADVTIKGEGTQSVTVPAGTYNANVIDEVMTEKILGYTTTLTIKTWVANGVGPVKSETTTGVGAETLSITEVLKSFTQG